MLSDRALLTIKAFIAAYETQGQPELPELAAIWSDLDSRADDIDSLARNHPQLAAPYQEAFKLLRAIAGTRKAGSDDVPEEGEDDDNRELGNTVRRLDRKNLDELLQSFKF